MGVSVYKMHVLTMYKRYFCSFTKEIDKWVKNIKNAGSSAEFETNNGNGSEYFNLKRFSFVCIRFYFRFGILTPNIFKMLLKRK